MYHSNAKEEFSYAYLHAVAAAAGVAVTRWHVDDDSIDSTLAFRGAGGTVRSPKLDVQLKATSVPKYVDDCITFRLKIKNYDDLIATDLMVPKILLLFVLPKQRDAWITIREQSSLLRHCGYWRSLRGEPKVVNTANVTVRIQSSDLFTPTTLSSIMQRLMDRELP
jgi:hypothetical protein